MSRLKKNANRRHFGGVRNCALLFCGLPLNRFGLFVVFFFFMETALFELGSLLVGRRKRGGACRYFRNEIRNAKHFETCFGHGDENDPLSIDLIYFKTRVPWTRWKCQKAVVVFFWRWSPWRVPYPGNHFGSHDLSLAPTFQAATPLIGWLIDWFLAMFGVCVSVSFGCAGVTIQPFQTPPMARPRFHSCHTEPSAGVVGAASSPPFQNFHPPPVKDTGGASVAAAAAAAAGAASATNGTAAARKVNDNANASNNNNNNNNNNNLRHHTQQQQQQQHQHNNHLNNNHSAAAMRKSMAAAALEETDVIPVRFLFLFPSHTMFFFVVLLFFLFRFVFFCGSREATTFCCWASSGVISRPSRRVEVAVLCVCVCLFFSLFDSAFCVRVCVLDAAALSTMDASSVRFASRRPLLGFFSFFFFTGLKSILMAFPFFSSVSCRPWVSSFESIVFCIRFFGQFYRVLLGFTGFHCLFLGPRVFSWSIFLGLTGFYWVFLGFIRFIRFSGVHGFPALNRPCFSGFCWLFLWVLLGFTGFYRV